MFGISFFFQRSNIPQKTLRPESHSFCVKRKSCWNIENKFFMVLFFSFSVKLPPNPSKTGISFWVKFVKYPLHNNCFSGCLPVDKNRCRRNYLIFSFFLKKYFWKSRVNNLRKKYNKAFQVGEKKTCVALQDGFGVSLPSKKFRPASVRIYKQLPYPHCMWFSIERWGFFF